MSSYISEELRGLVAIRATHLLIDKWADHFKLDGAIIRPLTKIGKATAEILGFNNSDRILERQTLIAVGRYPTISAKERMKIIQ